MFYFIILQPANWKINCTIYVLVLDWHFILLKKVWIFNWFILREILLVPLCLVLYQIWVWALFSDTDPEEFCLIRARARFRKCAIKKKLIALIALKIISSLIFFFKNVSSYIKLRINFKYFIVTTYKIDIKKNIKSRLWIHSNK